MSLTNDNDGPISTTDLSDEFDAFLDMLKSEDGEPVTPEPSAAIPTSNTVELFDKLEALLGRFIAFPSDEALWAVVLWIAHAHTLDAFDSTPRLALLSPEKGSGKTRTLEILSLVVPEPTHAVNMSAAALYRLVGDRQPTLLLDEADTYLGAAVAKQHEDLRGLINAGHRRGAEVYRGEVAGKAVKVVSFPAFAACALAGIGDLPDTILDRSIVVSMKRRAPNEHLEGFRERKVRPEGEQLRARLTKWAATAVHSLTDAWPEMPPGITDRPADVWEPLLACADNIGGRWPERGRRAAVALNEARSQRDPSLGVQLLVDIRGIFNARGVDRLTSEHLVDALCHIEESPWGELRGEPIDPRGIARRLRRFEVRPGDHRFGDEVHKGYRREDFHDAWTRYLPDVADVADVAQSQPHKGGSQASALFEGDLGDHLHNNKCADPPPLSSEGQQAQHRQREATR